MTLYFKSLIAGLIAGLSAIQGSLQNGSLTLGNYIAAIIALLAAFSAVAFIPTNKSDNKPQ